MFCTNCGEKVDESKRFCPHCGQQIATATPPAQAPAPDAQPVPEAKPIPAPSQPGPKSAPDPVPAQKPKPNYLLIAFDILIGICALFLPIVTASFLSLSITLPDIAQGAAKLASLTSLTGSSSGSKILSGTNVFATLLMLAVVVSVAVDIYRDFKGGGSAISGFVGLAVAAVGFIFVASASKEIASSLSGFGVSSVSSSVIKCGMGVWGSGLAGLVSIVMHARRP